MSLVRRHKVRVGGTSERRPRGGFGEIAAMKNLRCLLVFLLLLVAVGAEEYLVPIRGPLEMTDGNRTLKVEDELDAVLLSASQGTVRFRPLVFVRKGQLDKQGSVIVEQANLLVGPYPGEEQPVAGVAQKGEKLQILRDYGDWLVAYSPALPVFTTKTPRWFHAPGAVAWMSHPPGLSRQAVTRLVEARTPGRARFPFVLLPAWVPAGYGASLEELQKDDRFGPSYRVLYRKGKSTFGVQYATGGIGDRWFEEPSRTVKVDHPFLGSITAALLKKQPPGGWTTHWVDVPGMMTSSGERWRSGHLGLTFDPSFSAADIQRILQSLKAVK